MIKWMTKRCACLQSQKLICSQCDHCKTLSVAANKVSGYLEKTQGREIVSPRGPPTVLRYEGRRREFNVVQVQAVQQ